MHFQTRPLTGPETGASRITDLYQLDSEKYPYVLASTASGSNNRFDILFAHPQQSLELNNLDASEVEHGFLDSLHAWWLQEKLEPSGIESTSASDSDSSSQLPFTGGWFIYLSYELAAEIEPVLNLPVGEHGDPVAMAVRCPSAVIYDHQRKQHIAVAELEYAHLLDTIEQDFNTAIERFNTTSDASSTVKVYKITEADTEPYMQQVARIKQYIIDGDIFQANLSRPWQLEINASTSDLDIFNKLANANPGSFAVLARFNSDQFIAGAPGKRKPQNHRNPPDCRHETTF